MAAKNQQPTSIGGMKSPNEHAPHNHGMPSKGPNKGTTGQGIASHGTPKPVGNGKKNPLH